jgi:glucans biosynthesis protein
VVGNKREYFSWRFAVDFAGGKLPLLATTARVDLKLEVSRGSAETTSCRPLEAINGYRAIFDLRPDESTDPINIKLYLEFDGVPLSESWFYQYSPPPLEQRHF